MIDVDIEDDGLDVLLVGLDHPAHRENALFKQLGAALALEWACRQSGETSRKPVALPALETLSDNELRQAAGFLYGLCVQIDAGRYPRTFAFCFAVFAVLVEEINLRSPVPAGVTVH
jgi:hypothetical protein